MLSKPFDHFIGPGRQKFFQRCVGDWKSIAMILDVPSYTVSGIDLDNKLGVEKVSKVFYECQIAKGKAFTVQYVIDILKESNYRSLAEFLEDSFKNAQNTGQNSNARQNIDAGHLQDMDMGEDNENFGSVTNDDQEVQEPTLGSFMSAKDGDTRILYILFCRDTEKANFASYLLDQKNVKAKLGIVRYNEILDMTRRCVGLSVKEALEACVKYGVLNPNIPLSVFLNTVPSSYRDSFEHANVVVKKYEAHLKVQEDHAAAVFKNDQQLLEFFNTVDSKTAFTCLERLKSQNVESLSDLLALDSRIQNQIIETVYQNFPVQRQVALQKLKNWNGK
jgi:hypothetical protein